MSHLQPLATLWGRLIEPVRPSNTPEENRKARMLAAVLLSSNCVMGLILIVQQIAYPTSTVSSLAQVSAVGLLYGMYWFARRGYTKPVTVVGIIIGTTLIFLLAMGKRNDDGAAQLYYLFTITIFAVLLVPGRIPIIVALGHIAGIVMYGVVVAPSFRPIAQGPLICYTVLMQLLFLVVWYNERLRKDQQARLVASEERYRTLVENMLDMVYTLSPNGIIRSVNRAAETIVGWSPDELVGTYFSTLIHPDDRTQAAHMFQNNAVGGQQLSFEVRARTRTGEYKWLESNGAVRLENGHVVEIFGVVRDISSRKQAEAQKIEIALERDRFALIENFVQAISHDFRTSLASIETSRYLIERRLSETDRMKLQPKLDQIQTAVLHVTEQLENLRGLLPLAKPVLETTDLNELISSVVDEFRARVGEKRQSIEFAPASWLPPATIDSAGMRQALDHLLRNAVAYTPDGGKISVRTAFTESALLIEVRDTGIGMTDEQLAHIFDLFYRGDEARSVQSGGVGIGLNIVRAIAMAHHGTIHVESHPGNGSTFTLSLPHRST